MKNTQNGWLAIQNQISTQHEMISTSCNFINDILFETCQTFMSMMCALLNEIKGKTTAEEEKEKLKIMEDHVTIVIMKLADKKQSYYRFHEQLTILISQQRTTVISIMNSLFAPIK